MYSGGDINADGFDDIVVGACWWGEKILDQTGSAYVYYGSAAGLTAASEQKIMSPTPAPEDFFSINLAGGGDINGDGYDDVLVAAQDALTECAAYELFGQGIVHIYYGSSSGLDTANVQSFVASDTACGDNFGYALAIVGDLNGDGYDEVMVGSTEHPAAYLFYGSAVGLDLASEQSFTLLSGAYFEMWVGAVGDVNGDGWIDVGVGASQEAIYAYPAGALGIYLGGLGGPDMTHDITLWPSDPDWMKFGSFAAAVGDLNDDGYDEVAVGAYNVGKVYLYYGSADGSRLDSEQQLTAYDEPPEGGGFGRAIDPVGDVNGDGHEEFLVSAYWSDGGSVYLVGLEVDADGDGVNAALDCDDADAGVGEAPERYWDWDEDGHASAEDSIGLCVPVEGFFDAPGADCDDNEPSTWPGAPDPCGDGVDSDCDGWGDKLDDEDGDGLDWIAEYKVETDPCDPDSDDDGLTDGEEHGPDTGEPDDSGEASDTADSGGPDTAAGDDSDPPGRLPPKRGCGGCAGAGSGSALGTWGLAALLAFRRRARPDRPPSPRS